MKKTYITCYLIVIATFVYSQWTWQNPLPQGNSLYSVYFLNDSDGFVAGSNGTILWTTDGGNNWSGLQTGTPHLLSSIFFSSPNTGYAAGLFGTIIKTTNGGYTWMKLSSGTENWLEGIYFVDDTRGFIVGGGWIRRPN